MKLNLLKGNTETLKLLIQDENGNALTTLGTATAVRFVFKEDPESADQASVLLKTLTTDPSPITIDDPSQGYIKIPLTKDEMDITPGEYFVGIQIEWDNEHRELKKILINGAEIEKVRIVQDIVRGS
ncbi:MAG: hypothetical protein GY817_01240 [bacterium]|nr:hypothetical protein [bacterium]